MIDRKDNSKGKKVTIYILDKDMAKLQALQIKYGLSVSGAIRMIIRQAKI